jgi:hypothetical protein
MDDSALSNVSFSSTAIVSSARNKRRTEATTNATVGGPAHETPSSSDRGSDDDSACNGSSYFDTSGVRSLITPERVVRDELDDVRGREWGVTSSRGIRENNDDDDDDDDDDYVYSSNRSIDERCVNDDLEEMFVATLRFDDDMAEESNEQHSFERHSEQSFSRRFELASSIDDDSFGKDDDKDRRGLVSFAVDTSFATNDSSRHTSSHSLHGQDGYGGRQSSIRCPTGGGRIDAQDAVVSSGTKPFNRSELPPTPTKFKRPDNTSGDDLMSIHGGRLSPDFSRDAMNGGVFSDASSAYPTPQMSPSPNEATPLPCVEYQAKADLFGLSPIGRPAQGVLKVPASVPFVEASVAGSTPRDESYVGVGKGGPPRPAPFDESLAHYLEDADNQSHFITVQSTNRVLFEGEDDEFSPLGLGTVKCISAGQMLKNSSDLCGTLTTEEESFYVENALSRSLSAEACLFSSDRKFGPDAAFRINSYVAASAAPMHPKCPSTARRVVDRAYFGGSFDPAMTSIERGDPIAPMMPQPLGSWTTCMDFNADSVMQSLCTDSLKSVDITTLSSDSNVEFHGAANRRGVRLSRLTKLKELGLEHKLKPETYVEYGCEDSSF